jgi:hypothetical protein
MIFSLPNQFFIAWKSPPPQQKKAQGHIAPKKHPEATSGTTWTEYQMQGGKNWILPKEINAKRFFWDSHWLEIWKNVPLWDSNGGSVAIFLWTLAWKMINRWKILPNPFVLLVAKFSCCIALVLTECWANSFLYLYLPFYIYPKNRERQLLCIQRSQKSTLIKKKRKFSSYFRKFRGIGCKVIYD